MTQPQPPFQPDSNIDHAWHDGYNLGVNHGIALAPKRTHPLIWVLVGAVGTMAVGGFIAGAIALVNKTTKPGSFAITGTMSLSSSDAQRIGSGCVGDGGYDDIRPGAEVKVTDEAGKTLATGRLEGGETSNGECVLPFTVSGVPAGSTFYQVEISHRGGLTYSEAEAREPLAFSLGE
ncbi:hypothetical protein ACFRFQ_17865 [Rhodococcus sp. NPDC056743]|uniref:hypothetical protein n=1 Tax=Rhodococcus sp. NPDC056743 TaxID=3345934 RepID=UPI00366D02AF